MNRHIAYLKYLLRHKWYVFKAGRMLGAPLWRLFVHDMSKFLPSEWMPYARSFYAEDGSKQYKPDLYFDNAWLGHQHRNKHHWQYWLLREDSGKTKALEMPFDYMIEMICDWAGAGKAITGKWEVCEWYEKNKDKIVLHGITHRQVNHWLDVFDRKCNLPKAG